MTSSYFSVALNGELHGFFSTSRGVRQGDPLSPYLFVLAMEGLSGILKEASQAPGFQFHWRCRQTRLTHLCFADDLMVFCRADSGSVRVIKAALDEFAWLSGLTINPVKSHVFISGVSEEDCDQLRTILGFQMGTLPVRYLGVPLITSRLQISDCAPLVERILSRIRLWTSATLTYAGRLQLIKSVLFSFQVYWSSIFILPATVVRRIEGILSAFLWKGSSLSTSGAKVAWASVCYPLREGGLGIKRVKDWNRAAILKHVWRLLSDKSSTWSSWVHSVLLRGRSFWQVRVTNSASWSWRKILLSRNWCRGKFVSCIGDGKNTSLWQDFWLPQGPLCDLFTFRSLTSTGLPSDARVADIIEDGNWVFPEGGLELESIWDSVTIRPHVDVPDHYVWKGHSSGIFSIDSAWDILRARRPASSVHHLLWFPGHIPKHSVILWLASLHRLHTMDRLQRHGVIASPECVLCGSAAESHEHLFFGCAFSSIVWRDITAKTLMTWPPFTWDSLIQWASLHLLCRRDLRQILARLVLSATVYFLWYERNNRVFHQRRRFRWEIIAEISDYIRSRLLDLEDQYVISPHF